MTEEASAAEPVSDEPVLLAITPDDANEEAANEEAAADEPQANAAEAAEALDVQRPGETDPAELERSLLEELDARQNEVLEQLDGLNARIEALIVSWTAQNKSHEADDAEETDEPVEQQAA